MSSGQKHCDLNDCIFAMMNLQIFCSCFRYVKVSSFERMGWKQVQFYLIFAKIHTQTESLADLGVVYDRLIEHGARGLVADAWRQRRGPRAPVRALHEVGEDDRAVRRPRNGQDANVAVRHHDGRLEEGLLNRPARCTFNQRSSRAD